VKCFVFTVVDVFYSSFFSLPAPVWYLYLWRASANDGINLVEEVARLKLISLVSGGIQPHQEGLETPPPWIW